MTNAETCGQAPIVKDACHVMAEIEDESLMRTAHDVLTLIAIAEEFLRMEDPEVAQAYADADAETRTRVREVLGLDTEGLAR